MPRRKPQPVVVPRWAEASAEVARSRWRSGSAVVTHACPDRGSSRDLSLARSEAVRSCGAHDEYSGCLDGVTMQPGGSSRVASEKVKG